MYGDDEVRGLLRKFRELREVKLSVLNRAVRLYSHVVDLIRRGAIVEYSDILRLLYAQALFREGVVKTFVTADGKVERYKVLIQRLFDVNLRVVCKP